jgi:hypothetical protein
VFCGDAVSKTEWVSINAVVFTHRSHLDELSVTRIDVALSQDDLGKHSTLRFALVVSRFPHHIAPQKSNSKKFQRSRFSG